MKYTNSSFVAGATTFSSGKVDGFVEIFLSDSHGNSLDGANDDLSFTHHFLEATFSTVAELQKSSRISRYKVGLANMVSLI